MKRLNKWTVVFAAVALFSWVVPSSVLAAGSDALVGSWDLLEVGSGRDRGVILTFNGGGTVIGAAPVNGISAVHGVWKKDGPNSYVIKTRSYQYGTNGEIATVINGVTLLELSDDGQTFISEITTTVTLPDGTVVATPPPNTVTGTRFASDLVD